MAAHALLIAAASGTVIEHSNSVGTFAWHANADFTFPNSLLDPSLPASAQNMRTISRSLSYGAGFGGGSESPQADGLECASGIRLVRSFSTLEITNRFGVVTTFQPLAPVPAGTALGAFANYQSSGAVGIYYLGGGMFHTPLLGQRAFVGFRMTLPDGPHFGFIELQFSTGLVSGENAIIPMYQPLRWAYESQPNVPITIPTPSAAIAFALPVGLFAVRRRRGSSHGQRSL